MAADSLFDFGFAYSYIFHLALLGRDSSLVDYASPSTVAVRRQGAIWCVPAIAYQSGLRFVLLQDVLVVARYDRFHIGCAAITDFY